MKIEDIVVTVWKGKPAVNWPRVTRFRSGDAPYGALVRVIGQDGTEGTSALWAMPTLGHGYSRHQLDTWVSELLGRVKQEMLGRDVADREWLYSQRYVYMWWGHVTHQAITAVDRALWDLAAKAAGLPLYKCLGACRHKVLAYASAPYMPEVEQYADLAVECRKRGYRAYKIKPGGGTVERIKTVTRLVREAVGDEMALMIDGQLQFTFEEALEIGFHLQDLGFAWWEDPVPHNDFLALDRLCGRLDIPIAYTDHPAVMMPELAEMVRRQTGLRIIRSDCAREGVTGLKKVCSLAEAFRLRCEVHSSSLDNLHVILSVANCDYFEDGLHDIYNDREGTFGTRAKDNPLWVDEEGYVHGPTAPGIGWHLEPPEEDVVETLR